VSIRLLRANLGLPAQGGLILRRRGTPNSPALRARTAGPRRKRRKINPLWAASINGEILINTILEVHIKVRWAILLRGGG